MQRATSGSIRGSVPPTIPVGDYGEAIDPFAQSGAHPLAGTVAVTMACKISDPEKHGDALEGFVTYNITTTVRAASTAALPFLFDLLTCWLMRWTKSDDRFLQTSLPSFSARTVSVRRRYQDFVWLREQLVREFPASIIPPIPEKNRLGMQ